MIREIQKDIYIEKIKEQLIYANFNIRGDILEYLVQLSKNENDKNKKIIDIFIENNRISSTENKAVCQDTGYIQFYFKIGRNSHIGFDLEETTNQTVEEIYQKYNLRLSIAHPVNRQNTQTNTPVFFDYEMNDGDQLEVTILIKGGGSENVSRAGYLLPTASIETIEDWVVDAVRQAGAKACPPYLIGVGIGGNLEKAVRASKKVLLERLDENSMDPVENGLSQRIIEKINLLPIGFQGLQFGQTAMTVKVKTIPCHIATLPVAVTIGCNAVRQGYFII
jgi:fumarate hydratase subunit alpha